MVCLTIACSHDGHTTYHGHLAWETAEHKFSWFGSLTRLVHVTLDPDQGDARFVEVTRD